MQFALDLWGNTVATGTEDGNLLVYDTQTFENIYDDKVSNNCVNGVSFHPYSSMLIATSGQRNFDLPDDADSADTKWTQRANDSGEDLAKHTCGGNYSINSDIGVSSVDGEEKWSELQVYGLHKNSVALKQLYSAYADASAEAS
jgi:WD40 repeat protein